MLLTPIDTASKMNRVIKMTELVARADLYYFSLSGLNPPWMYTAEVMKPANSMMFEPMQVSLIALLQP